MITAVDIAREAGRSVRSVRHATLKLKIPPAYANPKRYFYTERQKSAVKYVLKKWASGHKTNKVIRMAKALTITIKGD